MIQKHNFKATGTTCESCAEIIKKQAMKVEGVQGVTFDYATETGEVEFDDEKTGINNIFKGIEEKGYACSFIDKNDAGDITEELDKDIAHYTINKSWIAAFFGIVGAAFIIYFAFFLSDRIALPEITIGMSYSLLFLVGLLTGFHCIAMCGGFVVSYTADAHQKDRKSSTAHVQYAVGKTLSYTLIGAIFGLLGSIIAFTPKMRGIAGLIAGLFLILFGLKMLNIIPALRKIQIKAPGFISKFVGTNSESKSPLVIGLLNGLMIACGPLQAIYIMAAGTGSMIEGAKLLFVFALGTLPVMLGFGYFASFISGKATHKILKASGVVVIILGLIMANNGLVLAGSGYDIRSIITSVKAQDQLIGNIIKEVSASGTDSSYQEIKMDVTGSGYTPSAFVLKNGVPVKWIINVKELTGCNREIIVSKYNLNIQLKKGEQTIEFTPTEEGTVSFSCWMGMLQGQFVVKAVIDTADKEQVKAALDSAPEVKSGESCGSNGGSCGCGMR